MSADHDSAPSVFPKPQAFELRISANFAAIFIAMGVFLPFFPLWLEQLGYSAGQIATILAAPMFLRVATTPLITTLADRVGERAHVLLACIAASFAVSLCFFVDQTYLLTLTVSLVLAVAWAPHIPLSDALALSGVRRFGSDFARMRIWGSTSFLLVNLAAGWAIASFGVAIIPALLSSGLAVALAVALALPRLGRPRQASPLSLSEFPGAARVLDRSFLLMVAGYGLVTGSHGFLYAFVSIYWQSLGIDGSVVGLLWAFSVIAEVAIFLVFRRLFGQVRSSTILAIGAGVTIMRWVLFPFVWDLGAGVPGFFAVQGLHAFSFGLTLLGVQKLIAERIPEDRTGAAQGVSFVASGLAMAAVTLVSGPLYRAFGADGFFAMAALTMLAVALILAGARSAPERRIGR